MILARLSLAWALWFVALFWLWMLFVGDWNRIEWIFGACVAAVAATIAESIRRAARMDAAVPLDVLRSSALVLPMVFVYFGILMFALGRSLVTREVVRGRYIRRSISPGQKTTPAGAARRAWIVLLAGCSPNALN